jgi:hypothetical protein
MRSPSAGHISLRVFIWKGGKYGIPGDHDFAQFSGDDIL